MWVNRALFQRILDDNKQQTDALCNVWNTCHALQAKYDAAAAQKIKDDLMLDWLRHRVNALEKERGALMLKATGIALPVPELVVPRPGAMTNLDLSALPSFDDVGDVEAGRLGLSHTDTGELKDAH